MIQTHPSSSNSNTAINSLSIGRDHLPSEPRGSSEPSTQPPASHAPPPEHHQNSYNRIPLHGRSSIGRDHHSGNTTNTPPSPLAHSNLTSPWHLSRLRESPPIAVDKREHTLILPSEILKPSTYSAASVPIVRWPSATIFSPCHELFPPLSL